MPKIGVEQIEGNKKSYSYLYPFEDLAQGSFQGSFYVCINLDLTMSQLKVNWELTRM